jgi:AAHS family 4-hydroxybenzoate transporter-like MFS transporter
MDKDTRVDIEKVLDNLALGNRALITAVVMALALIVDGFDIILLGYVAPSIVSEFHLGNGGLGGVLTASLLGVAVGGFSGGYLGDRLGRRAVVFLSLLLFGVASFFSATASDIYVFTVARLIAGLGLGATTPNAAALLAEVLPTAWRSQMIMITSASSTIGTTVAGLLAKQVLPTWGWRGLFLAGAMLPLVVCVGVVLLVPESPRFLASRPGAGRKTARALNRLLGRQEYDGSETFVVGAQSTRAGRLRDLFMASYRRDTLALWAMVFMTLFAWVALGNWGTVVITSLGHPLPDAISVMVGYNLFGLAGALTTAFLLRRLGSRRIFSMLVMIAGGASLVFAGLIAVGEVPLWGIAIYVFIIGATLTSMLHGGYPVAANVYPTDVRATGVGFAFGFGRLGAVSSSAVTAALIAAGGPPLFIFGIAVASALILCAVLILRRHIAPRGSAG